MFLAIVHGEKSFEQLRTTDGIKHITYILALEFVNKNNKWEVLEGISRNHRVCNVIFIDVVVFMFSLVNRVKFLKDFHEIIEERYLYGCPCISFFSFM